MSDFIKIEASLTKSIADFKLSQEEQYTLRDLLDSLANKDEMLAYTRNKAFELYRDQGFQENDNFSIGIKWLEKVIKTIDGVRASLTRAEPKAFFSPGDSCASEIIYCIQNARQTIDICVFTISDNRISEAILSAHERGITIRIISDNFKADDQGSDINYLAEKGLDVRLDKSPHHMHHKFAIFDQTTLINGSFNWTRSASTVNEENITVLYDAGLVSAFTKTFEDIWRASDSL